MRFVCDSCHAQYSINDEKVGPSGVIVRCKKCGHKIVVKRPAPVAELGDDASLPTTVMQNPLAALGAGTEPSDTQEPGEVSRPAASAGPPPPPPDEAPAPAESAAIPDSTEGLAAALSAPEPSPPPPPVEEPPAEQPAAMAAAPADDEIGRAFDSVLSGLSEPAKDEQPAGDGRVTGPVLGLTAAGSAGDDVDRQSTRVVNLSEMANLTKTDADVGEKRNGSGAEDLGAGPQTYEWYVAINDQQVGPLTVNGVRERWDKGELSADSLVWRVGMGDWRPLSAVDELSMVLVPIARPGQPRDDKIEGPAGAVATGLQAPAAAPLPPQSEPNEVEWKPSAASALESLVKQELDVLGKPAPKQKTQEVPKVEDPRPRGLMDELPAEPVFTPSSVPAVTARVREAAQQARESEEALGDFSPRQERRPPGRSRLEDDASPARSAYAVAPPESMGGRTKWGPFVAVGAGAGLLGVGLIALVLVLALRPATPVGSSAGPTPPVAVGTAPVQPALSPPVAAPVQPPPVVVAVAPQSGSAAPAQPELVKPNVVARADVQPPVDPGDGQKAGGERRDRVRTPRREHSEPSAQRDADPPAPRAVGRDRTPKEPEEAAAPRGHRTQVDDDFDRIFGGKEGASPPPEPSQAPKATKRTIYVPPAPGAAAAPAAASTREKLGPGEITEVVASHKAEIRNCVAEQKAKDPSATGTIVMRWEIRPNGSSANVQTRTPEFQKSPMATCMASLIKTFRFPPYSGPQMDPVDFPFKF